jgi:hypothetical protein
VNAESPNTEAERVVRVRFLLPYLLFIPVEIFVADAIVSFGHGRPLDLGDTFLLVAAVVASITAVGLGALGARAIVLLLVPRSISIQSDRIVGDFRRAAWKGAPEREIRLADVGIVGKTRFLRIPVVRVRPGLQRNASSLGTDLFYLTPSNLQKVQAAVSERAESADRAIR